MIAQEEFIDALGDKKFIKSKELKKSVFGHSGEAGIAEPDTKIDCPIQNNPEFYQRANCHKITDKGAKYFIKDLTQSRRTGLVRFQMKMPFFDTKTAIAHMDLLTGHWIFYRTNGKYWRYRRYGFIQRFDLVKDPNIFTILKFYLPKNPSGLKDPPSSFPGNSEL
nr:hypothetical protein orf164 [Navicula sp.]